MTTLVTECLVPRCDMRGMDLSWPTRDQTRPRPSRPFSSPAPKCRKFGGSGYLWVLVRLVHRPNAPSCGLYLALSSHLRSKGHRLMRFRRTPRDSLFRCGPRQSWRQNGSGPEVLRRDAGSAATESHFGSMEPSLLYRSSPKEKANASCKSDPTQPPSPDSVQHRGLPQLCLFCSPWG